MISIRHTDDKSSEEAEEKKTKQMLSSLRSFLLIVAFSVHNLFEGMAVGLEESSSGVWQLFSAVIIHSVAIIFCIGTDLVIAGCKPWKHVGYMILVSSVTPAGVIIGLVVSTGAGTHHLLVGVMQGLAAGTLLYITFFEVLERERLAKYGMSGITGVLIVIMAFTLMAGINSLGGGHSHGGGGHQQHIHHGHSHHEDHGEHQGDDLKHQLHSKFGDEVRKNYAKDFFVTNKKYDHFHEEYDINHGDHVHHIDSHSQHSDEPSDLYNNDELFDYDHITTDD